MYLLLTILIVSSCKSTNDSIYKIDPRTFVQNKVTLSTIADDIKYYPLDNSIPFTYFKYIISPNSLYIAAKGIGILKFNREGKLLKRIGNKGRGPGEFLYGMNFVVDERSGNIYLLDPKKIKVYSQSGRFLKDLPYDSYITSHTMPLDIEINNSFLFLPDFVMEGDSKYNWVFIDTLGNLVSQKENSVPHFQTKYGRPGTIYKFDSKIFYYNYYNDTIFSINPDLSNKAMYLFAQGYHRWPRLSTSNISFQEFASKTSGLFLPLRMFETKRFIVIRYYYLHKATIALIDKKTKKTFLSVENDKSGNSENSGFSLINDLDGGMPLNYLDYYTENDEEYITTLINPFYLKTYISSDEFKRSIPKYPEKKKDLEILAGGFNNTDNPILVMIRLKKNE
jgi:hypothetical protein